jgi:hypothetical protein
MSISTRHNSQVIMSLFIVYALSVHSKVMAGHFPAGSWRGYPARKVMERGHIDLSIDFFT